MTCIVGIPLQAVFVALSHEHYLVLLLFPDLLATVACTAIPTSNFYFKMFFFTLYGFIYVIYADLQQHASTIRLMDYIPKLADKWREIGTLLGEEDSVLLMESQPSAVDPINCMRRIFKSWIDSGERTVSDVTIKPTWEYLVKTLRNTSVNKGSIADDIERMIITLNVEGEYISPIVVYLLAHHPFNITCRSADYYPYYNEISFFIIQTLDIRIHLHNMLLHCR